MRHGNDLNDTRPRSGSQSMADTETARPAHARAGKLFESRRNHHRHSFAETDDGGVPSSVTLWRTLSMIKSRLMLPLAAAVSLGLAFAPAALAQGMSKDKMEKSSTSKSNDGMKKNSMTKDNTKKDNMSDGMKKK
jgi:pentapeptide MXKDX repeat protein